MIPRGQTPERREYMKAWHAANPRDRRTYKAAYDAAHQAENKAYREANRERRSALFAVNYIANREEILARVKARYAANPEPLRAYAVDYYAANTDLLKANAAAWRKANPEKVAHVAARRRGRKAGNGGSHTFEERRAKFALFGNRCAYCREAKPLTLDHDMPIRRGGTDDIDNILPACRSCNSRKHTRTAAEFLLPVLVR